MRTPYIRVCFFLNKPPIYSFASASSYAFFHVLSAHKRASPVNWLDRDFHIIRPPLSSERGETSAVPDPLRSVRAGQVAHDVAQFLRRLLNMAPSHSTHGANRLWCFPQCLVPAPPQALAYRR